MPARCPPPANAHNDNRAETLEWKLDVPIITHPLMLAGYVKIFGLTAILMGALLSFLMLMTRSPDAIPSMLLLTAATTGGLFVVGLLASALIYGNRMSMRFRLDPEAAETELIDRRAKAISMATIVLGTLAGKPGAVGTGLISASDSHRRAAWRGIVSAKFHPGQNAISLKNAWRTVMILFCTPANYAEVAAFVEAGMKRHPTAASSKRNPLPKLLSHTVLVIAAMVPIFTLPHPVEIDLFLPLLTLCFALASLWLIPILAWVVFGGLGLIWFHTLQMALAERRSMFDRSLYRAYEVLSGDDIAHLAAAAIGTTYLVWLCLGLLRGRIASGLAGDMAELDDS